MSLVRFRSKAYGRVAQSVEHLTFNQVVRGSNPRTLSIEKARNLDYKASSFFRCYTLFTRGSDKRGLWNEKNKSTDSIRTE